MEQKKQLIVMMYIKVMDISLDISCYPTTKSKERPILPKVTSTGYMIPRNVPTPSKSLIVLRILMGILFTILITRFTHIYFSYVIPNLK